MTTRDPQISEYLIRSLTNVGLSINQACVYLACLKLGNASIWDISLVSGVKRTTCYVVIEDLISKGIANKTEDNKRTLYSVISPDDFWYSLKNKQNQLANTIDELNSLATKSELKPSIRMFEGKEGIEQTYNLTLNLPEDYEILIYGNPEVIINYQEMINAYIKERVSKKIRVRAIIPDTPLSREIIKKDREELRETRLLPKEIFNQQTEVNILPSSIIYIAHSDKKPFATIIESSTLALEEKNRFEILWNSSKNSL